MSKGAGGVPKPSPAEQAMMQSQLESVQLQQQIARNVLARQRGAADEILGLAGVRRGTPEQQQALSEKQGTLDQRKATLRSLRGIRSPTARKQRKQLRAEIRGLKGEVSGLQKDIKHTYIETPKLLP